MTSGRPPTRVAYFGHAFFFFSSRRRHTRCSRDWSSDVCSSDLLNCNSSFLGELALAAARLPVPRKEELQFKSRAAWRYIGKDASLYDLENICTGKAVYGMDASIEGMVYASIEHPPVLGGKVESYQDQKTLLVPGVRQTVLIGPPSSLRMGSSHWVAWR